MGLDQAIRKLTPEVAAKITARQSADWNRLDDEDIEQYELTHEEYASMEELWIGRKENHIHRAIEDLTGERVENCDYVFLTKGTVLALLARLKIVNGDHSQAAEVLPPQAGFFFGSTGIDEWYFRDIENELEDIHKILQGWDDNAVYAYWAWW